jgi:hypothetical protein
MLMLSIVIWNSPDGRQSLTLVDGLNSLALVVRLRNVAQSNTVILARQLLGGCTCNGGDRVELSQFMYTPSEARDMAL